MFEEVHHAHAPARAALQERVAPRVFQALRASAAQRAALVLAALLILWSGVFWALR